MLAEPQNLETASGVVQLMNDNAITATKDRLAARAKVVKMPLCQIHAVVRPEDFVGDFATATVEFPVFINLSTFRESVQVC